MFLNLGVVQIRETNTGNYPPVVYQPLRSPKSPYAKYGPGSSSTLPAKLGARLMNQTKNVNINNGGGKDTLGIGNLSEINANQDIIDPEDTSLWPRFLQSPRCPHDSKHQQQQRQSTLTTKTTTTKNNNKRQIRQAPHLDHSIDLSDLSAQHPLDHHHMQRHNQHQFEHHPQPILTTDETPEGHLEHNHSSVDRDIRGSSEENSNASSDHTSVGYYSEDSSQSITDVCGSPLELKVQIRQCSDEKILKKNLSQDNLLKADFISRPNEKCKYRNRNHILLLSFSFL